MDINTPTQVPVKSQGKGNGESCPCAFILELGFAVSKPQQLVLESSVLWSVEENQPWAIFMKKL